MKTTVHIVLLACSMLFSGCMDMVFTEQNLRDGGYLESWSPRDGRATKGIVYDAKKNLKYDLYVPNSIDKASNTPLMLFIHGGAWIEGRRQDIEYACKYYAKHGIITATLDYSLISRRRSDVTIYTMLDEITACIGSLKKTLSGQGYKTPKIALAGFSAGGHLALLYSYSRAAESPIPIAFVFEKVGPTDIGPKGFEPKVAAGLVTAGSGTKITAEDFNTEKGRRLAASLSPASCVTPKSVPTIFAYGKKDMLITWHHREALEAALKKNSVPYIAVDFPNSHHGMWDDPQATRKFKAAVLAYCKRYMR